MRANWMGRQWERVQPGWVARGHRCRHKQSVSHKHGHPHQPAATRDFYELGECGCVYSHSPVPAGMLGTASLPAASTAGSSQLREGSVSRGPWISPTVWFTSGLESLIFSQDKSGRQGVESLLGSWSYPWAGSELFIRLLRLHPDPCVEFKQQVSLQWGLNSLHLYPSYLLGISAHSKQKGAC